MIVDFRDYIGHMAKLWSRLNRSGRRVAAIALTLSVAAYISISLFGDALNELPDRWHLPFLNPEPVSSLASPTDIFSLYPEAASQHHPIDDLISQAHNAHECLLEKRTHGVAHAAQAYRIRRGRHPPPRFDEWVAFAEAHDCLMIEDFFDRIYHDLDPFWAIPSDKIRADAGLASNFVRVRNGATFRTQNEAPFMKSYFELIDKLAPRLPDLDVFINHMDEPRVLVPWHTIAQYMETSHSSRSRSDLGSPPAVEKFTPLAAPQKSDISGSTLFVHEGPYWHLVRQTCSPESQTSTLDLDEDLSTPPTFPTAHPYGSHSGFVQNWTVSQDFCRHAHLRNMHGTFVEPVSISTAQSLVPIFSGSKLLGNNDILLPAAVYWADEERFAANKKHFMWKDKRNEAFWRGTASGGRNTKDNWTRFQRHRLVSLLNGTQVDLTLNPSDSSDHDPSSLPHNFPPPNQTLYPLISSRLGLLGDWIRSFSNVAFYWLECFPSRRDYGCSYSGAWYRRGRPVPIYRMYLNKYLPDVDGNSFSGRFRSFLFSNSLPIKATIYTEWHDSRLVPWKHFVPMDNTFVDMLGVFEYLFMHDDRAEEIALEGRRWAERMLRKEDMLVYVYRLLLEYARLSHPHRDDMGYGGDLK